MLLIQGGCQTAVTPVLRPHHGVPSGELHGDVRSENVLLTAGDAIKLSGFASSTRLLRNRAPGLQARPATKTYLVLPPDSLFRSSLPCTLVSSGDSLSAFLVQPHPHSPSHTRHWLFFQSFSPTKLFVFLSLNPKIYPSPTRFYSPPLSDFWDPSPSLCALTITGGSRTYAPPEWQSKEALERVGDGNNHFNPHKRADWCCGVLRPFFPRPPALSNRPRVCLAGPERDSVQLQRALLAGDLPHFWDLE